MFSTAIENFVLFSTLFSLGGFMLAWLLRAVTLGGRIHLQPFTLTRLYAATRTVPPVIAAWLVAAALLPEWWLGEEAFDAAHSGPFHQLHLLSDLTAALEPRLAYATLLFVFSASAFGAWKASRGYRRIGGVVHRLKMDAALPPQSRVGLVEAAAAEHKIDVGLILSDYPFSFVWGFRRSKLILSSGLLHALTPEQLTCVIEHEAAHHARRDNSVKLALSFASYLSLVFPLSRLILRWRAEQVEMVCDEVAAALLVVRLRSTSSTNHSNAFTGASFSRLSLMS